MRKKTAAPPDKPEDLNLQVEKALLRRCLGYEYTETRQETDAKGGEKTVHTTKHMPPHPASIALWLQHKDPETWNRHHADTNDPMELIRALVDTNHRAALDVNGGEEEENS